MRYRDFFELRAEADFTRAPQPRTASPRLGIGFCLGTLEGQGPLFSLRKGFPWLTRAQAFTAHREPASSWRAPQGPKFPFLDLVGGADAKLFGVLSASNPVLRVFPRGVQRFYRKALDVASAKHC